MSASRLMSAAILRTRLGFSLPAISMSVSASKPIAVMGVLSSWDTFDTISRRARSSR